MQCVQDRSQNNLGNLNNVRHEGSRHFRNKKKEYLKAKIEERKSNNEIKNMRDLYRSIIDFKKGYQPRTDTVEDEYQTYTPLINTYPDVAVFFSLLL